MKNLKKSRANVIFYDERGRERDFCSFQDEIEIFMNYFHVNSHVLEMRKKNHKFSILFH